jgi:hypothetical protein
MSLIKRKKSSMLPAVCWSVAESLLLATAHASCQPRTAVASRLHCESEAWEFIL